MPLRQRHVVDFTEEYTRMVEELAARLQVTKMEVFRRAIECLYRETPGKEAE